MWAKAKFLRKPTEDGEIEFPKFYIARHEIPQAIKTDLATIVRSK